MDEHGRGLHRVAARQLLTRCVAHHDVGRTHQVVLAALDDESVTFELGGQLHTVPIATASRYWFGDFLLLWRPPMAVAKAPLERGPWSFFKRVVSVFSTNTDSSA
jgi:hypothetical protein